MLCPKGLFFEKPDYSFLSATIMARIREIGERYSVQQAENTVSVPSSYVKNP
jgi:hypothetical protein